METSSMARRRKTEYIFLENILPNPAQPRRRFDEASLEALAGSIREHGLLSPILVRKIGLERYELIAGERRLRAMKLLGHKGCDAIIISAFDCESALIALIENIQREQLDFLEEAEACRNILEQHSLTQEELARRIGKSPSALANRLRLLRLPEDVRRYISESGLSERHARALLGVGTASVQMQLAKEAHEKHLSVRQLESRIEKLKTKPSRNMKNICRDMRLYVNAVKETVLKLRQMGANADSEILHTDVGFDIIIHISPSSGHASDISGDIVCL